MGRVWQVGAGGPAGAAVAEQEDEEEAAVAVKGGLEPRVSELKDWPQVRLGIRRRATLPGR